MTAVLKLICQGETLANKNSRFPCDDPLTDMSLKQAHQLKACFGPFNKIWTAPALAAQQTALELGLRGEPAQELAEPGYGHWAGTPIKKVVAQDEEAFQRWLLGEAPPGGESIAQVMARTGTWLSLHVADRGCQCAIVSSGVIRAMVVRLLDAPASAFQRIDILPLSVTTLRSNGKRWHLTCLGRALDEVRPGC